MIDIVETIDECLTDIAKVVPDRYCWHNYKQDFQMHLQYYLGVCYKPKNYLISLFS